VELCGFSCCVGGRRADGADGLWAIDTDDEYLHVLRS